MENKIEVHPWKRFFARWIDLTVLGILSRLLFPTFFIDKSSLLSGLIVMTISMPIEAIIMGSVGTTIGKLIFKIRILQEDGRRMTPMNSFKRSFYVWLTGLGAGIPFVWIFAAWSSKNELEKTHTTFWDKKAHTVVYYGKKKKEVVIIENP